MSWVILAGFVVAYFVLCPLFQESWSGIAEQWEDEDLQGFRGLARVMFACLVMFTLLPWFLVSTAVLAARVGKP